MRRRLVAPASCRTCPTAPAPPLAPVGSPTLINGDRCHPRALLRVRVGQRRLLRRPGRGADRSVPGPRALGDFRDPDARVPGAGDGRTRSPGRVARLGGGWRLVYGCRHRGAVSRSLDWQCRNGGTDGRRHRGVAAGRLRRDHGRTAAGDAAGRVRARARRHFHGRPRGPAVGGVARRNASRPGRGPRVRQLHGDHREGRARPDLPAACRGARR